MARGDSNIGEASRVASPAQRYRIPTATGGGSNSLASPSIAEFLESIHALHIALGFWHFSITTANSHGGRLALSVHCAVATEIWHSVSRSGGWHQLLDGAADNLYNAYSCNRCVWVGQGAN